MLKRLYAEITAALESYKDAQARAIESEARATRVMTINDLVARNAYIELMNAKLRRDRYGERLLNQLELGFAKA